MSKLNTLNHNLVYMYVEKLVIIVQILYPKVLALLYCFKKSLTKIMCIVLYYVTKIIFLLTYTPTCPKLLAILTFLYA